MFGRPYDVGMKTKDAVEYFGKKSALAEALGIKKQSIYTWGLIVPFKRQLQLEKLTNGKLRAMSLEDVLAK